MSCSIRIVYATSTRPVADRGSVVKSPPVALSRRCVLGTGSAAAFLAAMGAEKRPALAYGSGFPGYDINLDARKRASDRAKAEMQAEMERAAAIREAKRKEAETKAAAAAPDS
eukprot:CAMPEP_0177767838 /NCGR_PEP_ID=MMETSP0491_2-20121128/9364_1 /TAXON_ID=63592 /ORGANISM="Tetraselmis chuii, Strain PLY429" /LENGTH=112 /DNA_ID=CAMNT_0019284531 /DNA_START=154 /DNA_END=492 /DNA_ORIENTATION=-